MAAVELALGRQDAVLQREDLAVSEAVDLSVHLDVDRDDVGHGMGCASLGAQRAPQVHQAAALGVNRQPAEVGMLNRLRHGAIFGQRLDKDFRKSATEIEPGGVLR